MPTRPFASRIAAGAALARELAARPLRLPIVVLGLARGGVPVAFEVARVLHAPLDVMVVRKIGMPGQPELAMGAIAAGGVVVHEPNLSATIGSYREVFDRVAEVERQELVRREHVYRAGLGALDLRHQTVILVDDGLATGCTMLAAVRAARQAGAAKVVVAAPVGAQEAADLVSGEADEVVILVIPTSLCSISEWYHRFEQVEDDEVCRLLALCQGVVRPPGRTRRHHEGQ